MTYMVYSGFSRPRTAWGLFTSSRRLLLETPTLSLQSNREVPNDTLSFDDCRCANPFTRIIQPDALPRHSSQIYLHLGKMKFNAAFG